jgi:hypothetical protein
MDFSINKPEPIQKGATKHVALIRPDGSIEIHEELPAGKALDRYKMLCLQVELYAQEGKHGYRAYMSDEWPIPEAEA